MTTDLGMASERKSKFSGVSPADRELFRQTVSSTTPIVDTVDRVPVNTEKTSSPSESKSRHMSERTASRGIVSNDGDLFYRSGVQKNTMKNLKRGRFKIKAEIDLHGCTQREASCYLTTFLKQCREKELDCVRVITGKGHRSPNHLSVIRQTTLNFLRHNSGVLAYCRAPLSDGGSGAFYVLLSS